MRSGIMKYHTVLKNSQKGKRNGHPNVRDTVGGQITIVKSSRCFTLKRSATACGSFPGLGCCSHCPSTKSKRLKEKLRASFYVKNIANILHQVKHWII